MSTHGIACQVLIFYEFFIESQQKRRKNSRVQNTNYFKKSATPCDPEGVPLPKQLRAPSLAHRVALVFSSARTQKYSQWNGVDWGGTPHGEKEWVRSKQGWGATQVGRGCSGKGPGWVGGGCDLFYFTVLFAVRCAIEPP